MAPPARNNGFPISHRFPAHLIALASSANFWASFNFLKPPALVAAFGACVLQPCRSPFAIVPASGGFGQRAVHSVDSYSCLGLGDDVVSEECSSHSQFLQGDFNLLEHGSPEGASQFSTSLRRSVSFCGAESRKNIFEDFEGAGVQIRNRSFTFWSHECDDFRAKWWIRAVNGAWKVLLKSQGGRTSPIGASKEQQMLGLGDGRKPETTNKWQTIRAIYHHQKVDVTVLANMEYVRLASGIDHADASGKKNKTTQIANNHLKAQKGVPEGYGEGSGNLCKLPNVKRWRMGENAIAGALAGAFVSLCLHPIDTIKTVLQTQKTGRRSALMVLNSVVADRGVSGLYRGLGSNLTSSTPTSAIYTFTYESVKAALLPCLAKEYQSLAHCAAGGCASIATSIIYTPSECIKQQMQVTTVYRNSWSALIGTLKQGGLPLLYSGWIAVLCRNVPQSVIKFYTYEGLKQWALCKQLDGSSLSTLQTLAFGGVAGSTAALFTTPFDVIKTRLQTQVLISQSHYKGVLHALQQIAVEEGIGSLYRGILPRLVIYMSQGALFFASYEFFKRILNAEVQHLQLTSLTNQVCTRTSKANIIESI
ncbi:hypothetical protein O6H91_14G047600 [Diphasiastrum complanatum]|uniref:Uncharacterized protein n=1 Tax=Diphasiastrum complanatum TaxID=34168 RepID=A0ACC2BP92_DIPCM|nr:hypothetical protein O6H91_14G047600 [Diphasiastrum complanatum]